MGHVAVLDRGRTNDGGRAEMHTCNEGRVLLVRRPKIDGGSGRPNHFGCVVALCAPLSNVASMHHALPAAECRARGDKMVPECTVPLLQQDPSRRIVFFLGFGGAGNYMSHVRTFDVQEACATRSITYMVTKNVATSEYRHGGAAGALIGR